MNGLDQTESARRRDVDGLRGLLFAMCLSVGLWVGMVGMVGGLMD